MKSPYLSFVPPYRLQMKGKGAPEPTLFGVLGQTKESPYDRSLGGLVVKSSGGKTPPTMKRGGVMSERGEVGTPPAKTHIPGAHYAQVPYAGKFMSTKGAALS